MEKLRSQVAEMDALRTSLAVAVESLRQLELVASKPVRPIGSRTLRPLSRPARDDSRHRLIGCESSNTNPGTIPKNLRQSR